MKPLYVTLFLLFRLLVGGIYTVQAEGTKEVMPSWTATSTNATGLIVSTSGGFPLGNVGSYVNAPGLTLAPTDNRIYFRIKNFATETLYYGFNWETLTPTSGAVVPYTDVFMLIYDPTGAPVGLPVHLTGSGAGLISTWLS